MKFFLGILAGLLLAISIAAGAAFVACDGDFEHGCKGDGFRIELGDRD